jgi:hypothetical protein
VGGWTGIADVDETPDPVQSEEPALNDTVPLEATELKPRLLRRRLLQKRHSPRGDLHPLQPRIHSHSRNRSHCLLHHRSTRRSRSRSRARNRRSRSRTRHHPRQHVHAPSGMRSTTHRAKRSASPKLSSH